MVVLFAVVLVEHRPTLVRSALLFPITSANGKWGEQPKRWAGVQRAYRANQLRHCCFTRTETRANVLESLADRSLVPA